MKRLTPLLCAVRTSGSKQSKLIDRLSDGFSSKLGSFEMHARWMTASLPGIAAFQQRLVSQIALDALEVRNVSRQHVVQRGTGPGRVPGSRP